MNAKELRQVPEWAEQEGIMPELYAEIHMDRLNHAKVIEQFLKKSGWDYTVDKESYSCQTEWELDNQLGSCTVVMDGSDNYYFCRVELGVKAPKDRLPAVLEFIARVNFDLSRVYFDIDLLGNGEITVRTLSSCADMEPSDAMLKRMLFTVLEHAEQYGGELLAVFEGKDPKTAAAEAWMNRD